MTNTFVKDSASKLDYLFDWRAKTNQASSDPDLLDWLATDETITSGSITATSGIIISSSALAYSNTAVQVWLMGGVTWSDYTVECLINTSGSRIDQRSIIIQVRDR